MTFFKVEHVHFLFVNLHNLLILFTQHYSKHLSGSVGGAARTTLHPASIQTNAPFFSKQPWTQSPSEDRVFSVFKPEPSLRPNSTFPISNFQHILQSFVVVCQTRALFANFYSPLSAWVRTPKGGPTCQENEKPIHNHFLKQTCCWNVQNDDSERGLNQSRGRT